MIQRDGHWIGQFTISLKDFKLFSQYKTDFNGIDGHALFIGTVIHSLDHYLNEKYCNPLMFDVHCEKYGKMNEMLRIVRSSFIEKPPGLLFRHMYKGIREPRPTNGYGPHRMANHYCR